MEPEHGVVNLGAPCTDKVGSDRDFGSVRPLGRCRARIQRLCGSRGRTFRDCLLGRMSMSGSRYDRGAARIGANAASARTSLWVAQISPSHWLRVAGLLITLMIAGAGWDQTQARSPRNDPPKRVIHGPNYRPPYAAIVVDDKSGFVLHEVSADEPRHPASLTKIMTLYLLFEQLDGGKLKLDTPLPISTRAALQNSHEARAQGQSDHQG